MDIPKIKLLICILILWAINLPAQSITGLVLDAKTNLPIESASVYFDNTTIGTSTNDKGTFKISAEPSINSPLIISFLGYEKIIISNYSANKYYKILLIEEENSLDEILITFFDGMPKETKLTHFREQFLGLSKNAKSCTILNEADLLLRFNKKTRQLVATSKRPINIKNENLQYEILFDIKDFIIDYSYVNIEKEQFRIKSVVYAGTSFFKPFVEKDTLAKERRNKIYRGSVLHFMRALANKTLNAEGYQIFSKSFIVEPSNYINVRKIKTSDSVVVKLRLPLSVLYDNKVQSEMVSSITDPKKSNTEKPEFMMSKDGDTLKIASSRSTSKKPSNFSYFNTEIIIDGFGNYSPIGAFYFIGYMSRLRVGDTLPLDYALKD